MMSVPIDIQTLLGSAGTIATQMRDRLFGYIYIYIVDMVYEGKDVLHNGGHASQV